MGSFGSFDIFDHPCTSADQTKHSRDHIGFPQTGGPPIAGWFIIYNGTSYSNGWFGGTPFLETSISWHNPFCCKTFTFQFGKWHRWIFFFANHHEWMWRKKQMRSYSHWLWMISRIRLDLSLPSAWLWQDRIVPGIRKKHRFSTLSRFQTNN